VCLCVLSEEQEDGPADDTEFAGDRNGLKTDEHKPPVTDEASKTDKPSTTDDTTSKAPEPDFTTTPSKDGEPVCLLAVCTCC